MFGTRLDLRGFNLACRDCKNGASFPTKLIMRMSDVSLIVLPMI